MAPVACPAAVTARVPWSAASLGRQQISSGMVASLADRGNSAMREFILAAFFWGCASVQAFPTGHASSTRRPLTPPRRQLALYRHHLLPVRPINCRTNGHLAGNRAISVALELVVLLTGGFSGTNKLRKTRQQCPRGGTPPMSAKCNSRRCSEVVKVSWE